MTLQFQIQFILQMGRANLGTMEVETTIGFLTPWRSTHSWCNNDKLVYRWNFRGINCLNQPQILGESLLQTGWLDVIILRPIFPNQEIQIKIWKKCSKTKSDEIHFTLTRLLDQKICLEGTGGLGNGLKSELFEVLV
jgi:hypothetical protein